MLKRAMAKDMLVPGESVGQPPPTCRNLAAIICCHVSAVIEAAEPVPRREDGSPIPTASDVRTNRRGADRTRATATAINIVDHE